MGAATSAEARRPNTAGRAWQLEPGAELGPWRVVEPLGAGGMGEVYIGEHAWLPTRRAALKVLRLDRVSEGRVADRFRAEAALLATIDHPNVVRLYDAQITEDGRAWMAMELLTGKPLSELLTEHGPVSIPETLQILGDVADGAHAAHLVGIVHRDLKPGNIFITRSHVAKVLDFGISKLAEHRLTLRDLAPSTEQNMVLGTIPYMSPEQLLGQSLDHRSDIYALGIIAYQMLTEHHPFIEPGERFGPEQLGYRALFTEPTPLQTFLPDCPMDLWLLIRCAFARKRDDRPSSMAKLAEKMRALRGAFLAERGLPIASLDALLGSRPASPAAIATVNAHDAAGAEASLADRRQAIRRRAAELVQSAMSQQAAAAGADEASGPLPPVADLRHATDLAHGGQSVSVSEEPEAEEGRNEPVAGHVTPYAAAATTEAVEPLDLASPQSPRPHAGLVAAGALAANAMGAAPTLPSRVDTPASVSRWTHATTAAVAVGAFVAAALAVGLWLRPSTSVGSAEPPPMGRGHEAERAADGGGRGVGRPQDGQVEPPDAATGVGSPRAKPTADDDPDLLPVPAQQQGASDQAGLPQPGDQPTSGATSQSASSSASAGQPAHAAPAKSKSPSAQPPAYPSASSTTSSTGGLFFP